jgi:hypothetical protein
MSYGPSTIRNDASYLVVRLCGINEGRPSFTGEELAQAAQLSIRANARIIERPTKWAIIPLLCLSQRGRCYVKG